MNRGSLAAPRHLLRHQIADVETIRKPAKSVQPHMGHNLGSAAFHHHHSRAVTVHLGDALPLRPMSASRTRIVPEAKGFSADAPPQSIKTHERSGLTPIPFS